MRKILFIGGSLNQTSMVHAIAKHLDDTFDCWFTPYYCDGLLKHLSKRGLTDFTILGETIRARTMQYLRDNHLQIDYRGAANDYELVVTTSDLIVQKNIRNKKIVLVQEGMTDPENVMYYLVKSLKLPRYLASTSTTGLSDAYDAFCVASKGYRDHFIRKGARPHKLKVTGIPNFDNAAQYLRNNFPHRHYVLVATSDARETLKYDNRKKFVHRAKEIANGRQLIFKLHPNEKAERATAEIKAIVPKALVYSTGNTNHMIANCDILVTQYSSVVYVGLALNKEVHSYFNREELLRLMPLQNGGRSAYNIARVCQQVIASSRTANYKTHLLAEWRNLKPIRPILAYYENNHRYSS